MKKQLLLSTFLTAALAVGTAHAAGMDKSTDASSSQTEATQSGTSQSGSMQSGQMESSTPSMSDQSASGEKGYDPSRVGVKGVAADQSAQITNNTDAVRQIQQALKDKGADLQVDGVWGPTTEQALMDFQKEHGQGEATGQPDQETLQALDVDLYQDQPQTAQTPSDTGSKDMGSKDLGSQDSGKVLGEQGGTKPAESWTSGSQGPAAGSSGQDSGSSSGSGSSQ